MPPKRKRAASSASKASKESITNGSPATKCTHNSRPGTDRSADHEQPSDDVQIVTGGKVTMPKSGADADTGEQGEASSMRMPAPPKAGAVDPVGYHTNPPPKGRPVRVYADGVFDLFHLGHMRQLQQAKSAFPETYLIVGVTGDTETYTRKGLTVMSGKERAESLRHCRWVDEVIEDCPWIINVEFLEKHRIDYVAHDDIPYGASEGDDIYKPIKEQGKFLVTQRTEGVSTTGIITKIVRDYDQYVARQLQRGTSRQELNISWLKKNEMDIKRHVTDLRDAIRTNWTTTGQELSKDIKQFWQPSSRPSSPVASLRHGAGGHASTNRSSALSPLSPTFGSRTESSGSARNSIANGSAPNQKAHGHNTDFAAGYAMGLIGGVRGWMEGSKKGNLANSSPPSPTGSPGEGAADGPSASAQ